MTFLKLNEWRNLISIFAIFLFIVQTKHGYGKNGSQKPGVTRYIIRTINLTTLDSAGQPYVIDMKWTLHNMKQYVSNTIINRKTYTLHSILFQFDRCRDLEFSCEDFISWNISNNLCSIIKMKNQLWSSPVASIVPKSFIQNFPRIVQGNYSMENASLDINDAIKFYNEVPKYYWKIHVFFFDTRKYLKHQFHMHVQIISYTSKRNHSTT